MLLQSILLVVLPCLVTSASLKNPPVPAAAERDVSPAEDPPPKHLVPSIERLYRNELEETPVDKVLSYQHLDSIFPVVQAFAARRRTLKQPSYTVQSGSRIQRDTESVGQPRSTRRHKAMRLPEEGTGYVYRVGREHRSKRGASSPAVDSVDENPAQWRRFDNKPQFVTSRTQPDTTSRTYYQGVPQHRVAHSMDENDVHNMRYNEIPPPTQRTPTQREPLSYPSSSYTREPITDYRREGEPPRRIIYYANLPEDTHGRPPVEPVDYRRDRYGYDDRYDYGRSYNKYPRESRYEDTVLRQPARDDRYRYNPPRTPGGYAIIDADRSSLPPRSSYPDNIPRYNRIPAPYQQSQPAGRFGYDQRRGPSPVSSDPDRPNAALHPSRYNNYGRSGGNIPRNQLTVTPTNPAGDELYRDYNPRQPAPWSLQIGTKLTVKDDGRPMPSPGGQRFYVQSQQQYPSRYLRTEDDPDTRQINSKY
ncbi:hypothetical protein L9F63_000982 [Diploptera punctata]|uniref:Uncharacterized protein n=1 Tax=Diploptera punctata TaxID=6984 RepID=A0AAD8ALD8_DIPPU|nr:hypothetical protein L9F63_000982 [Diploptera punctata]